MGDRTLWLLLLLGAIGIGLVLFFERPSVEQPLTASSSISLNRGDRLTVTCPQRINHTYSNNRRQVRITCTGSAPQATPTPRPTASPTTPPPAASPTSAVSVAPTPSGPASPSAPPSGSATLVGAGDIANCSTQGDTETGDLLRTLPGTVFTAGDNVYNDGTAAQFRDCFMPTGWGAELDRIRPAPGNHDYHVSGARDYYAFFGEAAGPAGLGYYAYDVGSWRAYSLNSEIINQAQITWLRDDLAANPRQCSVAYWHHPLFSSGRHGNDGSIKPLWDALHAAGADVIIGGHDHNYERLAPMLPSGQVDQAGGIRSFVVGTGGTNLRPFDVVHPSSEVRNATDHGLLELTLGEGAYSWRFVPVAGDTFTDQGAGTCH